MYFDNTNAALIYYWFFLSSGSASASSSSSLSLSLSLPPRWALRILSLARSSVRSVHDLVPFQTACTG